MLATLSLVIRHEALARRGETIYRKSPRTDNRGLSYLIDSDLYADSILIFLEHKHEKFNTCNDDRAI
jgi:hypothetical protein